MKHSAQALTTLACCCRFALDNLAHITPRRSRMNGYGQIQLSRQTQLRHKRFALILNVILTPIVVQTDLTHSHKTRPLGRLSQERLDLGQLLSPRRIFIHRRWVQTHHRIAIRRIGTRQIEHTGVAVRVDRGQEQTIDARRNGALDNLRAIVIKFGFVYMRMGVY